MSTKQDSTGVLRQLGWGLLLSVVAGTATDPVFTDDESGESRWDGYAGAVGVFLMGPEFEAAD